MKCFNCKTELPEGTKFCSVCGMKQPDKSGTKQYKKCPSCSTRNESEAVYCCSCGMKIDEEVKNWNDSEEDSVYVPEKTFVQRIKEKTIRVFVVLLILAALTGIAAIEKYYYLDGNGRACVTYLKDGKINLIDLNHLNKAPFEYDEEYGSLKKFLEKGIILQTAPVQYSTDKQYVYYPSNIEEGENQYSGYACYTLNRCKKDGSEERKIDDFVTWYTILEYDVVVYGKSDGSLYVNDSEGKKKKVTSKYENLYLSKGDSSFIYTKKLKNDRTYAFVCSPLQNEYEEQLGYADEIYVGERFYQAMILKDDGQLDNLSGRSYSHLDFVDSDVESVIVHSDEYHSAYYTKKSEISLSYDDLFEDNCMDVDIEMTKPNYEDYITERIEKNIYTGRYEVVEVADDDAYEEAWTKYVEAEKRNELREIWNEPVGEYYFDSLYHCNTINNETTKIDDTFFSPCYLEENSEDAARASVFIYNRFNTEKIKKMKLSQVCLSEQEDVREKIRKVLDKTEETCIHINNQVTVLNEVLHPSNVAIDEDKKIGYGITENGDLVSFSIDETADGTCTVIAEHVRKIAGVVKGKVYYFKNLEENEGDLYCNSDFLDSEVHEESVEFVDDAIIYAVNSDTDEMSATLKLYDGKKAKIIAEDVSFFKVKDKNRIALLVDYNTNSYRGDLKYYNGTDELIDLDEDVEMICDVDMNAIIHGKIFQK